MGMWVNGYIGMTFLERRSILGKLIQIKYEGKTLNLLDHIGKQLLILRRGIRIY